VYDGVEDGAWYAADAGLLSLAHVLQQAGVDLAVRVLSEKGISSAWRTLAADATADGKVKLVAVCLNQHCQPALMSDFACAVLWIHTINRTSR
jgi:hypothetical protein